MDVTYLARSLSWEKKKKFSSSRYFFGQISSFRIQNEQAQCSKICFTRKKLNNYGNSFSFKEHLLVASALYYCFINKSLSNIIGYSLIFNQLRET